MFAQEYGCIRNPLFQEFEQNTNKNKSPRRIYSLLLLDKAVIAKSVNCVLMHISLPLYFHCPHLRQHTFIKASEKIFKNIGTQVLCLKVYNLESGAKDEQESI